MGDGRFCGPDPAAGQKEVARVSPAVVKYVRTGLKNPEKCVILNTVDKYEKRNGYI